jgi:general secretion pathway protein C
MPDRLARFTAWLPALASVLLVVAIAYSLAELTWRMVPQAETEALAPAAPAGFEHDQQNGVDVERIVTRELFGSPDPEQDQELDLAEIDAPDTQLNLTLRGVMATDRPGMASAIIASGRNDENSYAIGDRITGGAMLRAVYAIERVAPGPTEWLAWRTGARRGS